MDLTAMVVSAQAAEPEEAARNLIVELALGIRAHVDDPAWLNELADSLERDVPVIASAVVAAG
jgi:hypothetical protein